jgi:cell wall-associated NlpC family hydrolase
MTYGRRFSLMMTLTPTPPNARRRVRAIVALAFGAATVASLALPAVAHAAPIDDKRKQAAALEEEINNNSVQLEALNEQIKFVQTKVDDANAKIADAQARIAEAKDEMQRIEGLVRQRAASIYRSSSHGADGNIFDLDIRTLTSREAYSSAAADRDNSLLDQLDAARQDLSALRDDAADARKGAEREQVSLAAKKTDIDAAQAERNRLLGQVKGELETLVEQAAAARRAAQVPKQPTGEPIDPSKIPPVSGRAGAAIEFAKAQIGKPYQYASKGPDSYDCSGLTYAAWQAAGVTIGGSSGAQYASLPHVPMNMIQAGDLIFWGPGGSSHVGLYVGGGSIIDASSGQGQVVLRGIWGSPIGAARVA